MLDKMSDGDRSREFWNKPKLTWNELMKIKIG
jgi:hypothetical protein